MRDLRDELGYDCDLCADPEMGPPIPDPHGPLLHFHKPLTRDLPPADPTPPTEDRA